MELVAAFTEDKHAAFGRNTDLDVTFPALAVKRTGLGCRLISAGNKAEEPEMAKVDVLRMALVAAFKIDDEVALGVSTNTTIACALDTELISIGIFNTGYGATIETEEADGKLLNVEERTDATIVLLEDDAVGRHLTCNLVAAESVLTENIFGKDRDITRWLEVNMEPDVGLVIIRRSALAVIDTDAKDISEVTVTIPA